MTKQVCIPVEAYEIKAELGGGFRGAARIAGQVVRTDRFETQFEAFSAIYDIVMASIGDAPVSVGHYRGNRFKKNYFVYHAE